MTTAAYPQADPKTVSMKFSKRPIDPILQEVYEIKAQLNAEAGYSLELLLARAGLGAISKPR